jgi:hypothetical protein
MKKTGIYFIILLLMLSLTLTCTPGINSQATTISSSTPINPNIVVTSYDWHILSYGVLDVVGEVQNIGPNTIDPAGLTGTVYSSTGEELSYSGCQVWVSYLLPQQKAPFLMEFAPPGDAISWYPSDVASVEFSGLGNETSYYQYSDLKITSQHSSIGTTRGLEGAYIVDGVIKNTGTEIATNISVVGAFFNKDNEVVGVGNTPYYVATSLAPSGTANFEINALDINQTEASADSKIASYSLLIQAGGPILEGTPVVSASPNSNSSQPDTPTSSPFSLIQIAIIIGVVIIAIVVVIAGIKLSKRKPNLSTKEKVKQRKQSEN